MPITGGALVKTRLTDQGTPVWNSGVYPFVATSFSRGASPEVAYDSLDIGLQVNSTDATLLAATKPYLINRDMAEATNTICTPNTLGQSVGDCTATRIVKGAKVRYGRIKLSNTYGSERLALKMPMAFEYWTSNGWQKNSLDTCTPSLPWVKLLSSNFAVAFPGGTTAKPNNLALTSCDSALSITGSSAPSYVLSLSKPSSGKPGWADVTLNLGTVALGPKTSCTTAGSAGGDDVPAMMPWLQYNGVNPKARATFGIFKSPLIYRRENY